MRLEPEGRDAEACAEAEAWLAGWLPRDYRERFRSYRLDLDFRREYQRAAFEEGWLMPSWEPGMGGRSLSQEAELWVKLRFARSSAPKLPNVQGPGVVAPALKMFGSEAQQEHVKPVLRGDEWWCLGMSEPNAGSDLASLRTAARRNDRGDFAVNGQKVWTSHARQSAFCLLFARTEPSEPRHRGISAFVVPMDADGITVRAIDKLGAGDEEFCEVFFDDVTVPASAMVGPLNGGWAVAMTSLSEERDMIWIMNLVEIEHAVDLARRSLEQRPNRALAVDLARLGCDADSIWLTGLRGLADRIAGRPDRCTPLLKLVSTETAQRAFDLASRAGGSRMVFSGPEAPFGGEVFSGEIEALGSTIYGGTSEIQRNIIGEHILGLPR
ncbi:MAG TPA: acyl-CoA dehydrogenase family protein [Solirubrobacteraceae bacterium]|nr:acyl-CoA dehydrogenase family protein [Solirubrobacteraceae bacterium]